MGVWHTLCICVYMYLSILFVCACMFECQSTPLKNVSLQGKTQTQAKKRECKCFITSQRHGDSYTQICKFSNPLWSEKHVLIQ